MAVTSSSAGYQFALKRILRPLVPKRVLEERNICHRLGSQAARPYAKLRLLDTLGIRHLNKRAVPPGARSFVFVCFGNIMRSPTAELMFKRALLNAKSIALVDPAAGGPVALYAPGLFERLGISAEVKPKLKLVGGGGAPVEPVIRGDAEIGLTTISEIIQFQPAIELVGPLPPEIQVFFAYAKKT